MMFRTFLMATAAFALVELATGAQAQNTAGDKLVNGQANSVEHPFRPKFGGGSFSAKTTTSRRAIWCMSRCRAAPRAVIR